MDFLGNQRHRVKSGESNLRVVYVTQDDLSRNSGYAFRVDRLRRIVEAAGHTVEIVGFCTGDPVIQSDCRRPASPLRRPWPLVQGLIRPSARAVITPIGAKYNGVYALMLRLLGKR